MIEINALSFDEKVELATSTNSPEILRTLALEDDVFICMPVASNPATPEDVLVELVKSDAPLIRHIVGSERKLPTHIFDEIIEGKNKDIRPDQIAGNEHLSKPQFAKLARNDDDIVRLKIAANGATPGEVLDYLSNDVFPRIVQAVARNLNTPILTLRKLLYSKEVVVRMLIMENPNFPPEYLATLAKDREDVVRSKVASASTVSANILRNLSRDHNAQVAVNALRNSKFPADGLPEAAGSSEPVIREAVVAAGSITPELVASLANDEDIKVRLAVACSPKTPVDTLFKMLNDNESEVKETVKFMLSYISEKGFEAGLINNGYTQYLGLPRDWVIKAL